MSLMIGAGIVLMYLPVSLIALLVVLIARVVGRLGEPASNVEPPLISLQRRYARGEISREEYQRIRTELA